MLILRIFVILDIKQFYCRGLEELGVLKGIFIGVFEIVYIFVIDVLELKMRFVYGCYFGIGVFIFIGCFYFVCSDCMLIIKIYINVFMFE